MKERGRAIRLCQKSAQIDRARIIFIRRSRPTNSRCMHGYVGVNFCDLLTAVGPSSFPPAEQSDCSPLFK